MSATGFNSMKPSEDIFDVVNDRDEVIGALPRSVVHERNLLHRAVHIWVFHPDGRYLLQKRSVHKDRFPDTWTSSVSGHVDSGEDYDTAAHREVGEEIGLDPVPPLVSFARIAACAETEWEFVRLYRTTASGPFRFPESEVSELRWAAPAEIDRMMATAPATFAPSFLHLWTLCRHHA